MTEKQIENIKDKIKRYRSRLTGEKRRFGGYFDSGGIRYVIPELYLQISDYRGALDYYRWFSREFPDDSGMPSFNLFSTLILYNNKKLKEAVRSVYKTAFSNTYLIYLICDKQAAEIDKSELTAGENITFAKEIFDGCEKLLTKDFKKWMCTLIETDDFTANMNKFISLQKLIKDEPPGPLRSYLIDESTKLEKQLTSECE